MSKKPRYPSINKWIIERLLFPAMALLKGNRIGRKTSQLEKSQSLPLQELTALRREKLRELLTHAIENVPAYTSYAVLREEIERDPFAALVRFPALEKKDFRARSDLYLSDGCDKRALIPNMTGGSTGEPTRFFMDRPTVESYEAARWRGLSWYGITPGSRSVMVWGNPYELTKSRQRGQAIRERLLKNRIVVSAYQLDPERLPQILGRIRTFCPEYLYGYASALYTLARMMLEADVRLGIPLKAAVSTSETLHAHQREAIVQAFGCPVANEYGARDGGILAFECPCGGLHVSAENAVIEVTAPGSELPLTAGECGSVLITDLNNFSQPRLRYRVGDMAWLSDEPCPCGRTLPLLGGVEGREHGVFITKSGRYVHGSAFSRLARSFTSIERFQVIQKSPDLVVMKVVFIPGGEERRPSEIEKFKEAVSQLMEGARAEIEPVNEIKPSASGKILLTLREF